MAKQTGWYYVAQMKAGEVVAHHFRAPLARGELHIPTCGEAEVLGRDVRHESLASTHCGLCEKLLEPESEAIVEAGLAEEAIAAYHEEGEE